MSDSDTPAQSGSTGCKSRTGASRMDRSTITRRGLLVAGVGALLGGAAVAEDHHDADSTGDLGVGGSPAVLAIGPGETYRLPSDETETYRAVNWADGGELNLDGELTLVDQA